MNFKLPVQGSLVTIFILSSLACKRSNDSSEISNIESATIKASCSISKQDILTEFKGRPKYFYSSKLSPSKVYSDEESEDRDELKNWIDAASIAVQKKCNGQKFNILAYFVKEGEPPITDGLKTTAFSSIVNQVPQTYYWRVVKTYVHVFQEGSFTWPGPRGLNNWQYNDYSDQGLTRRDGMTVFFSPIN